MLSSCVRPQNTDALMSGQVMVVFEDCPIQTSTNTLGGIVSQVNYSTIAFIDKEAVLVEYEPSLSGRDTLIIPTYQGYAEMMHLYQAIEYDYFLFEEGDTVVVKYDANDRPKVRSLKSERNTSIYNMPYEIAGAIQKKGYHIETVMSNIYFTRAFEYFRNRNKYANLNIDDFLKPKYVNLDSLAVVYEKYKSSFKLTLDSLLHNQLIDSRIYDYYYHRTIPEHRYKPSEIVQSDSLLHYISNYISAQDYCIGKNTLESFDMIANDTVATQLAKNGILKRLINNIMDGEDGWHVYSDDIVSDYIQKYRYLTGDLQPEQRIDKKEIIVDSSRYALPLETVDGQSTSLNEVLKLCKDNFVYVDFWASWCAPCLAQIPFSKELHERLSGYDIKFIYISVDTDRNNWERKVRENADIFQESYRVTDSDAAFLKDIQFSRIPRYLIFDRQGKLIDPDAIRPSDENIDKKIITLLNETEVNR